MKEFRVARCLNTETHRVDEYAIFADGSKRKIIETDKDGNRYFRIENTYNKDCKQKLRRGLFSGRIEDAITAVRDGAADVVAMNDIFGMKLIEVRYYLDRTVGDAYRAKTIEGWKDTIFKYAVLVSNKHSMSSGNPINKKTEDVACFRFDEMKNFKPAYFDTEDDAAEFIESVIVNAFELAKKYCEYANEDFRNKNLLTTAFAKLTADIEEKYGTTKHTVLVDMIDDMVHVKDTDDAKAKDGWMHEMVMKVDEPKLIDMVYRIEQVVAE